MKTNNEVLYTYNAEIVRVVDGDTVVALIDLGHNLHIKRSIRLLGIDTPEIRTKNKQEKENGYKCKIHLEELLNKYKGVCIIQTIKRDSFGRWLANIWVGRKKESLTVHMQLFMDKNKLNKK